MDDTRIETLTVGIELDGRSFKTSADDALSTTERTAKAVARSIDEAAESQVRSLERVASGASEFVQSHLADVLRRSGLTERAAALGGQYAAPPPEPARPSGYAAAALEDIRARADAISAEREHQDLLNKARAVEESLLTVGDRRNKQLHDLNRLLEGSYIGQNTYNDAVSKLEDSLPSNRQMQATASALDAMDASRRRLSETVGKPLGPSLPPAIPEQPQSDDAAFDAVNQQLERFAGSSALRAGDLQSQFEMARAGTDRFEVSLKQARAEAERLGASKEQLDFFDAIQRGHQELNAFETDLRKTQAAQAEAAKIKETLITDEERHADAVKRLNDHLEAGRITQREYNQVLGEMERQLPQNQKLEAFAKGLEGMLAGYKRQVETAGMTPDQAQLYDVRVNAREAGLTPLEAEGRVQDVSRAQADAEAATAKANLRQAILGVKQALNDQAATAGMSTDELTRYRLAAQGADADELRLIESMQKATAETVRRAQANREFTESMPRLIEGLREQAATAGMTPVELQVRQIRAKGQEAGLKPDEVEAHVKQYVEVKGQAEAAQESARMKTRTEDLTKSLSQQIQVMDVTSAATDRYRTVFAGLATEQDRSRQVQAAVNDAVVRYQMAQDGATIAQVREVEQAQAQARARQHNLSLMERGQQLTDSVASSGQRYSERLAELAQLLNTTDAATGKAAISQETYNKAMKELHSEHLVQTVQGLAAITDKVAIFTGLLSFGADRIKESGMRAAGAYEDTVVAFSTMMGSAEKAKGFLSELTDFAVKTPFEMPELENVSRQLIMFGESQQSVMETTEMLGNVASGVGKQHFNMLGIIYNQIRGVGHLLTGDFRQMATRGAVSLQDIAKYYKVTDAAAMSMISHGKVSFEDFRNIMIRTTQEGGRFANMMEKQSETLTGLSSTYSDAQGIALRKIAENMIPVEKAWLKLKITVANSIAGMEGTSAKLVAGMLALGAGATTLTAGLAGTVSIGARVVVTWKSLTAGLEAAATATKLADGTTAALTLTNKAATAGLWALTAAKWAAAGAGVALGVAVAGVVAYNIVKWAHESTEAFKQMKREMQWADFAQGQEAKGLTFEVKTTVDRSRLEEIEGMALSKVVASREKVEELNKAWWQDKEAIEVAQKELNVYDTLLKDVTNRKVEVTIEAVPLVDRKKIYAEAVNIRDSLQKEMDRIQSEMTARSNRIQRIRDYKDIEGDVSQGKWRGEAELGLRKRQEEQQKFLEKLQSQYDQAARDVESQTKLQASDLFKTKSVGEIETAATGMKDKHTKLKDEVRLQEQLLKYAQDRGLAIRDLTKAEQAYVQMVMVEGITQSGDAGKDLAARKELIEMMGNLVKKDAQEQATALAKITEKYQDQAVAIGLTKDQQELLSLRRAKTVATSDDEQKFWDSVNPMRYKEAVEAALTPAEKLRREMQAIEETDPEGASARIGVLSKSQRDAVEPVRMFRQQLDELYTRFAGNEPAILEEHLKNLREQLTGVKDKGREAAVVLAKIREEAEKSGDVAGGEERARRYIQTQAGLQDPARAVREQREQMRKALNGDDLKAWEADMAEAARRQAIPAAKVQIEAEATLVGMEGRPDLIQRQAEAWMGLKNPIRDATEQMNAYVEALRKAGMTAEQISKIQADAWRQQLDPLRNLKDKIADIDRQFKATGDVKLRDEALRQLNRSVTDSLDPTATYADKVADLAERHQRGGLGQKDYDLAMREAKKSLGQLTDAEMEQIQAQTRRIEGIRAGTDAMRQAQQYALEFLAQNKKAGEQMLEAERMKGLKPSFETIGVPQDGQAEKPQPGRSMNLGEGMADEWLRVSRRMGTRPDGDDKEVGPVASQGQVSKADQRQIDKYLKGKTAEDLVADSQEVKQKFGVTTAKMGVDPTLFGGDTKTQPFDIERLALDRTNADAETAVGTRLGFDPLAMNSLAFSLRSDDEGLRTEAQFTLGEAARDKFSPSEAQTVLKELEPRVAAMSEEEKGGSALDELAEILRGILDENKRMNEGKVVTTEGAGITS